MTEQIVGAIIATLVGGILGAAVATVAGMRPIKMAMVELQLDVARIKQTIIFLVDGKLSTGERKK